MTTVSAPCSRCKRPIPVGELILLPDFRTVCEPCNDEIVRAESTRDSIDAAWAACEATLPRGWGIDALTYMGVNGGPGDRPDYNAGGSWWQAGALLAGETEDRTSWAYGETPAQALRALAQKFADRREGG